MKGLKSVVVLDFSKLLPGPYCTQTLADLGCRVIRVELPHWPDAARELPPKIEGHGFCYWMVNRNKESLCLDFRKPEGMRALEKLLAKADVVVEGFRPGLMDKLGLGAKTLTRKHPRLVYCSITGWGEGPWAKKAGHDVQVPFTPGRTDASQEQTDVESFAVLEPTADGFHNYLGQGHELPAEHLLLERAKAPVSEPNVRK